MLRRMFSANWFPKERLLFSSGQAVMNGLILKSDHCEDMDHNVHIPDLKEDHDFNNCKGLSMGKTVT